MWHLFKSLFRPAALLILSAALILTASGCILLAPHSETIWKQPTELPGQPTESDPSQPDPSSPESVPGLTDQPSTTPDPTQAPSITPEPVPTAAPPPSPEPTAVPQPTVTPSPDPDPATPDNGETIGSRDIYMVQSGNTLYQIAVKYGMTLDMIAAVNHIADPNLIYPGQILLVSADLAVDLSRLDNSSRSWTYHAPSLLSQDIAATVSFSAASLVQAYDVVWQLPSTGQNTVYLSMDTGYEYNNNTAKILDIAADKNVQLSFFVTGSLIQHYPALVQRMVDEGHQVGNHTERHLNQPLTLQSSADLVIIDILQAEQRLIALTGKSFIPYLRPPSGVYSDRSLALLRHLSYRPIFWSFAYPDWQIDQQLDPQIAYDRIMGQLHDGSVLLLHTVSNTNAQIFARLIDGIRARGYTISRLP